MNSLAISTAIREVVRGELGVVRTVPDDAFAEGNFDGLEERARQRRAFEKKGVDVAFRSPERTDALGPPDANLEILRLEVDLVLTHSPRHRVEEEERHAIRAEVSDDVVTVRRALSRSGQMVTTAAGTATGLVSGMLTERAAPLTVREDWQNRIIETRLRMQGWVLDAQPMG